jgi:hypothetical protein
MHFVTIYGVAFFHYIIVLCKCEKMTFMHWVFLLSIVATRWILLYCWPNPNVEKSDGDPAVTNTPPAIVNVQPEVSRQRAIATARRVQRAEGLYK